MARDFASGSLDGGDVTFWQDDTAFENGWSFFIEVLVDSDDGADMVIFEKTSSTFAGGFALFLDDTGNPGGVDNVYDFYVGGSRTQHTVSNLNAGSWQTLIGNVKWAGDLPNNMELYVDGVAGGSFTASKWADTANPLYLGQHNSAGDRRYLNGKLARFTVWDVQLTAAQIATLAGGAAPAEVQPNRIIRHWPLLGTTSPEPEAIDGTDTLTVTSATQSASRTVTSAALSNASITANGTTAVAQVDSTKTGGAIYCYVVPNPSTEPTAAQMRSGAGATFHSSEVGNFGVKNSAELIHDADQSILTGPIQSVATDGTWYWISWDDNIHTFNSSFVYQGTINVLGLGGVGHSQLNGMHVNGTTMIVTANNYPTTPSLGWVFEFSIAPGTGLLTYVTNTSLSEGGFAEYASQRAGSTDWWVAHHDKHGLDRYNSSWVFQEYHAFPAGTDPGTHKYQSCVWIGDYVFVNVHEDNARLDGLVDVYYWNGTSFEAYSTGEIYTPTESCTQGFYLESGDSYIWADRETDALGSLRRGDLLRCNPINGTNDIDTITGLTDGVDYDVYFMHDLGLGEENIDSSIVTATTASGPVITPGAVTDSGGSVRDGETFTITYSAGGLTGTTSCTLDGDVCADYTVLTDTTATATAPTTGVNHTGTKTLSIS